jgi:hypothetical protein
MTKLFKSKQDWAEWLEKNHQKSESLWLRLAKKDSALYCFDWRHHGPDRDKLPSYRTAMRQHADSR